MGEAAEVTMDELTGSIAGAVKAAMVEAMGEVGAAREAAAEEGADVLTREKFDEELAAKMGETNEKIKALEQAAAEAKLIPVVDEKSDIIWPLDPETLVRPAQDERVRAGQKLNDELYVLQKALGLSPEELLETETWKRAQKHFGKALDTTTSGSGSEWIPVGYSSQLIDIVALEAKVAALFDTIQMPTKSYKPPVQGGWPTVYLASENTAITANTATMTDDFTLTAVDLGCYQGVGADVTEDTLLPVLPRLQMMMAQGLARAKDDAILNGDVTATHMDTDIEALGATDHRTAWSGLRYYGLNTSNCSTDCGTFNADNLLAVKKQLGIYGINPDDVAFIAGPSVLNQLLLLLDAQNNLVVTTVDKYGAQAAILTGEVGKLFGVPVVPSEFVREGLNASGVEDGVTETKTTISAVNRKSWVVGDRRNVQLEQDKDIVTQTIKLVATWRGDFKAVFPAAETHTTIGYNIAQ
jgi:HK97 family phage major capsid protein